MLLSDDRVIAIEQNIDFIQRAGDCIQTAARLAPGASFTSEQGSKHWARSRFFSFVLVELMSSCSYEEFDSTELLDDREQRITTFAWD